jgi:hypothetical protein
MFAAVRFYRPWSAHLQKQGNYYKLLLPILPAQELFYAVS